MWFPTDKDVRNIIRSRGGGLEVERLESIIESLRDQGDNVYYKYIPSQVCEINPTKKDLQMIMIDYSGRVWAYFAKQPS